MTRKQYEKLRDEEKNIKIAELCGAKWYRLQPIEWKERSLSFENFNALTLADGSEKIIQIHTLPDYCHDLNAMHKAVSTLTKIQFCKYIQILCGHTKKGERIHWCGEDAGRAELATAEQRAEAFCLTIEEEHD